MQTLYRRVRWHILQGSLGQATLGRLEASVRVPMLTRGVRHLNDTLATTELAGHYWVWSGMLLGWRREGQLLRHDRDVDFALLREDLALFESAVPSLVGAGFHPYQRYLNNDGHPTEFTFKRHRRKFDFFIMDRVDGELQYHVYGWPPDQLIQVDARVPEQPLVEFDFLGRRWLRPADADLELTACYGDWQTPDPNWNYLEGTPAVRRQPWTHTDVGWSPDSGR
jgi:hypothetical protein